MKVVHNLIHTGSHPKGSPLYAVIFDGSRHPDEPFSPYVVSSHKTPIFDVSAEVTVPHGLARDMAKGLPGLWYCMHLPTIFQQFGSVTYETLVKFRGIAIDHCFLYAPLQIFNKKYIQEWPEHLVPTLAVCPDEIIGEVRVQSEQLGFALPAAGYSDLSNTSLQQHWRAIHAKLAPDIPFFENEITLTKRLDLASVALPTRWLKRQIEPDVSELVEAELGELVRDALMTQAALGAFSRAEAQDMSEAEAEQLLPQMIGTAFASLSIPVTIAVPGVATAYTRRIYSADARKRIRPLSSTNVKDIWGEDIAERSDDMIERAAIELVATHHATARTGIGLLLPSLPQPAYTAMAELERHWTTNPTGQTVAQLLGRINEACAGLWTEEVTASVAVASKLMVYSSFPFGLVRFPGDTSPLNSRVPIMYKSLNPLSGAMQAELTVKPPIDIGQDFRVLVAECIESEDVVGRISRAAWDLVRGTVGEGDYPVEFYVAECLSTDSLRNSIAEYEPDILVISAHGTYRTDANLAGLIIGRETCLGPELGDLPPVVILSACHVAPRGAGAVNVADLLLRQGAYAVLGTQVPVDAAHNAILMSRLFLYLAFNLSRHVPDFTLLDAWHFVQKSNAVHDIVDGNRFLQGWGRRGEPYDSPVAEFKLSRLSEIRLGHLYEDSERILVDIADRQGLGRQVRNWLRNPGYLPESLFYVFIGIPDCVYFGDAHAGRPRA
jgi:hypothetical protein